MGYAFFSNGQVERYLFRSTITRRELATWANRNKKKKYPDDSQSLGVGCYIHVIEKHTLRLTALLIMPVFKLQAHLLKL